MPFQQFGSQGSAFGQGGNSALLQALLQQQQRQQLQPQTPPPPSMSVQTLQTPRGPFVVQQPPPYQGQGVDEAGREAGEWMKEHPEESWWMKGKGYQPGGKEGQDDGSDVEGQAIGPVKPVPALKPGDGLDTSKGKTPGAVSKAAARIDEGWGEAGTYKREVEADTAEDVWKLHRSLSGDQEVDWSPKLPAAVPPTSAVPTEPMKDQMGRTQLPEPEPEQLSGEYLPKEVQQAFNV